MSKTWRWSLPGFATSVTERPDAVCHLPCFCVAELVSDFGVSDGDELSHDGGEGDHLGFAIVPEAFTEGFELGVVSAAAMAAMNKARWTRFQPQEHLTPRGLVPYEPHEQDD
jgi:hypothetical protein